MPALNCRPGGVQVSPVSRSSIPHDRDSFVTIHDCGAHACDQRGHANLLSTPGVRIHPGEFPLAKSASIFPS